MCMDGVRTRTVTCVSNIDGRPLSSLECAGLTRPDETEACDEFSTIPCHTFPVWVPGPWGPVSSLYIHV